MRHETERIGGFLKKPIAITETFSMIRILMSFLTLFVFLIGPKSLAETVNSDEKGPLEITIGGPLPIEQLSATFSFAPRTAKFSNDRNQARCFADPDWNSFSFTDKAGFVEDTFRILLARHQNRANPSDPRYRFSPRILTCKVFKESSFDPMIGNESGSSALGMGQVLEGTAADALSDRVGFRSVVPGYENISSYAEYRRQMAREISLQLDLGLGVMEMKRQDFDLNVDDARPFLRRYLGSSDSAANDRYAESIFQCANCVKNNNNLYSQECLCKAKPEDENCVSNEHIPQPSCR